MSAENESNTDPEVKASSDQQESAEQLKEISRRAETPPELGGYTTGAFEEWLLEQGDTESDMPFEEMFLRDMEDLDDEGEEES